MCARESELRVAPCRSPNTHTLATAIGQALDTLFAAALKRSPLSHLCMELPSVYSPQEEQRLLEVAVWFAFFGNFTLSEPHRIQANDTYWGPKQQSTIGTQQRLD